MVNKKLLTLAILIFISYVMTGCNNDTGTAPDDSDNPVSAGTYPDSTFFGRNPIEVKQLNDHLWLLNDNGETTGFVLAGSDKAAVIDTMYGYEDIYKLVRTLTDLPLVVINTHGHLDHIYGNAFFKQPVYIHEADVRLAKNCYGYYDYKPILDAYQHDSVEFTEMYEGDIFDLGGITLEVYQVKGHTEGSVCLLDREDKILFTGDVINRHCWMQLPESTSLEELAESLDHIKGIRNQYEYILHSHTQDFDDASLYEEFVDAVDDLLHGSRTEDEYYTYFGGVCKQHKFPSGNGVIVYQP